MTLKERLLRSLKSGIATPLAELAARLHVTTAVLDETALDLLALKAPLHKDSEKLTLLRPLSLLDLTEIVQCFSASTAQALGPFDIFWTTDSTNQQVLERWSDRETAHGYVCLAEFQHQGRGRRGRVWVAPIASSLCLSVGWHIAKQSINRCGRLSTAIGVAIIRFLCRLGVEGAQLKWPNDILISGRKIGGILIETRSKQGGLGAAIGIGLNIDLAGLDPGTIDQAYIDLASCLDEIPSRSELVGGLLNELIAVLHLYEEGCDTLLLAEWSRYDCCRGKTVRLSRETDAIEGVACGIDTDGALLLLRNGQMEAIQVGNVTLREG